MDDNIADPKFIESVLEPVSGDQDVVSVVSFYKRVGAIKPIYQVLALPVGEVPNLWHSFSIKN